MALRVQVFLCSFVGFFLGGGLYYINRYMQKYQQLWNNKLNLFKI